MKTEPLKLGRDEKFCQLIASGTGQYDAYLQIFSKARKWTRGTVDTKAWELRNRSEISERIRDLQEEAAERTVCTIAERRKILSEIARGNVVDYVVAGPAGGYVEVSKDSPNTRALKSLKCRTVTTGEGDGKRDAIITEVSVRDPHEAIDILNRMDRVYQEQVKITAGDGLAELASALASGMPTWLRRKNAKNNLH